MCHPISASKAAAAAPVDGGAAAAAAVDDSKQVGDLDQARVGWKARKMGHQK